MDISLEDLKAKRSRLEFAIEQSTADLVKTTASMDALKAKVQEDFGTTDPIILEQKLAECEVEYTNQLEELKKLNITL